MKRCHRYVFVILLTLFSFLPALSAQTLQQVIGWGDHSTGQLGIGPIDVIPQANATASTLRILLPPTPNPHALSTLSAGTDHAMAIRTDGAVFAWGRNDCGQVGNGKKGDGLCSVFPEQVLLVSGQPLINAIAVSSRYLTSYALQRNGTVLAWGDNRYGQLGNGVSGLDAGSCRAAPVQDTAGHNLTGIVAIASGRNHCLALMQNGTVLAWGRNEAGQLGDGTTIDRNRAAAVKSAAGAVLTDIVAIAAGSDHNLALRKDGAVIAWGSNSHGQLGIGASGDSKLFPVTVTGLSGAALTGVKAISCGSEHSVALLNNSSIAAWGANESGQLGTNTTSDCSQAMPLVDTSGTLLTGFTQINGGGQNSLAVTDSGNICVWGSNSMGQLGCGSSGSGGGQAQTYTLGADGQKLTGIVQAVIGTISGLALLADGSLLAWGGKVYGQQGNGFTDQGSWLPARTLLPEGIGSSDIAAISAGYDHTLFLMRDGRVLATGSNQYGQLGYRTLVDYSDVPDTVKTYGTMNITEIKSVAAGKQFSLALYSEGSVVAWGRNANGELGNNGHSDNNYPSEVMFSNYRIIDGVTAICAGQSHSLALMKDGTVCSWGKNDHGQLGNGTTTDSPFVVTVLTRDLTPLSHVVAIRAGCEHSVALLADGSIMAWGGNGSSQLGDGTTADRSLAAPVNGLSGGYLTGILSISAGGYHTSALSSDGSIVSWGANSAGQLGDGTLQDRGQAVAAIGSDGKPLMGFTGTAAGGRHTLGLRRGGILWTVGNNAAGVLGIESMQSTLKFGPIAAPKGAVLYGMTGIAAGVSTSFAVQDQTAGTYLLVPPHTARFGQPVLLRAALRDGTGKWLSGEKLTLYWNSTLLGTVTTDASGIAAITVRPTEDMRPGVGFLSAFYSGANGTRTADLQTAPLTLLKGTVALSRFPRVGRAGEYAVLLTRLCRGGDNAVLTGRNITFRLDGVSVGTAVTGSDGIAALSVLIPADTVPGTHSITEEFAGDDWYIAGSSSCNLTVYGPKSSIKVVGGSGKIAQPASFSAKLIRSSDSQPLRAKTVRFLLKEVLIGEAVTSADGTVKLETILPESLNIGQLSLQAIFAGDSSCEGSSAVTSFQVNKGDSSLSKEHISTNGKQKVYIGTTLSFVGSSHPREGRIVKFRLAGKELGNAVTDSTGHCELLIDLSLLNLVFNGEYIYTVSYAGDDKFSPASTDCILTSIP